jgi:hypothetical protein
LHHVEIGPQGSERQVELKKKDDDRIHQILDQEPTEGRQTRS